MIVSCLHTRYVCVCSYIRSDVSRGFAASLSTAAWWSQPWGLGNCGGQFQMNEAWPHFFQYEVCSGYTIMVQNVCEQQFWHVFHSFSLLLRYQPYRICLDVCFGVLGAPGEFVLQNAVSWLRWRLNRWVSRDLLSSFGSHKFCHKYADNIW